VPADPFTAVRRRWVSSSDYNITLSYQTLNNAKKNRGGGEIKVKQGFL